MPESLKPAAATFQILVSNRVFILTEVFFLPLGKIFISEIILMPFTSSSHFCLKDKQVLEGSLYSVPNLLLLNLPTFFTP